MADQQQRRPSTPPLPPRVASRIPPVPATQIPPTPRSTTDRNTPLPPVPGSSGVKSELTQQIAPLDPRSAQTRVANLPVSPGAPRPTVPPQLSTPSSVAPPPLAAATPATSGSKGASFYPLPLGQPRLADIIYMAYENGFSDIHISVTEAPRLRNRGEMDYSDYPETDRATFMSWIHEILSEADVERFQKTLEYDGAADYDFARVRINIFMTMRGPAMVLRLIPLKILTIDQLRLPQVFRDICHAHKGLILITGPTGSGKSTSMAAMVDYINSEMPKHIITIEDPIEFVHRSRKALIRQREVGLHTHEFDRALKSALREDPDVILIGEMRDRETVNTALKAAQTGHVVMGTLHTNSAIKTIERILGLYSAEEQPAMRVALAESIIAVIAQGLCRTTDGKRAAFHDILVNTDTIKDYIRDGKYDEILPLIKDGEYDGMITMNQSLFNLYQEGRITEEAALEWSPTPNEMAQMLRGRV
ncbi:type IV pilus twitching motility protein PilT [Rubidibacter lacunae]|nr:type IV pilus twitching motility protein PilT [Rubidibacter lacunae]